MLRTLGLVVLALGSGILVGRIALDENASPQSSPGVRASPFVPESKAADAPAGPRAPGIDALERRLEAEAAERRRLEQRVEALAAEVSRLHESAPAEYAAFEEIEAPAPVEMEGVYFGDTFGALVAAGVDESRAREIKRQMDALDLEMMNMQYEATQNGWDNNEELMEAWREVEAKRLEVREVIGEEAYDRYLYAMGQPNRIAVQDVLEGSPAQRAGLESGDLLVSYDGERLFTLDDLMRESRSGDAGQTVTLDVLRDGHRLQIYMPRGPLGVRSGFQRADPDESP